MKSFFLKKYITPIILAFLVGIISVAPQIQAYRDPAYKGIQMFGADAEYDYVAKMNQGFSDAGKPFYLAPQFGERFMGGVARTLDVRVIEVNVAFKFISAFALFLIIYFMLLDMFGSRVIAFLGPLFVILGINIITLKFTVDTFLPYTRPISPQLSSLLLFLGMWGIFRLIRGPGNYKLAVGIGALVGLSLYVYIYSWAFLMGVLGLYLLYFLWQRSKQQVLYILSAFAINGLLIMPFFLNLLRARQNLDYVDTSLRIGMINTHMPILSFWLLIAFILVLALWPREQKTTKYFFLTSFIALAVLLNQQIITGARLQPGHFHWYYTKPLIAIVMVVVGWYWLGRIIKEKKIIRVIAGVAMIVFFANGIYVQAYGYKKQYAVFVDDQRFAWLIMALSTLYPGQQTIWADHRTSTLIEAYTQNLAPNKMMAPFYLDSRAHLRDMLFLEYRIQGVEPNRIREVIERNRDYVTSRLFGIYYRDLPGSYTMSDAYIGELVEKYAEFSKMSLAKAYEHLGVDLFINDRPNEGFSIHQVIKE